MPWPMNDRAASGRKQDFPPVPEAGKGVTTYRNRILHPQPSSDPRGEIFADRILVLTLLVILTVLFPYLLEAQEAPQPEASSEPQTAAPQIAGMETTGTLDVGYRWTAGLRGSEDLYRSLVNLGEGPKLFGANLSMNSPLGSNKYIDRLQFNASAWGGDPYNTLRLYAEKVGTYQFSFDYRKVDYFNFIPSFANPLLGQGILIGQHSFDSTRRTMDFDLTLRPGARVSPFLAYSHNSGFGPGITTYTADQNEFAVNNQLRDTSDYYRGGVIFNFPKVVLTLEQGYLTFKDDQRIFQTGGTSQGNRSTPALGQDLVLNQLDENYHVRGSTPISRAQVTATPWERLTITGRFVYSQPDLNFDYDRRSVGNFLSFDVLRFYTGEVASGTADGDRPHTLGNLSLEFRPHSRITILESVVTDHFHIAASSSLGRSLTETTPLVGPPDPNNTFSTSESAANRFAVNLNQNQLEGIVSLTSRLSLRGGYRYVWSDTQLQSLTPNEEPESISLHRNVGLAGLVFRLPKKADLSLDFEAGQGNQVYSRTDILDYRKVRLRGRYHPWEFLTINGSFFLLDHENPRSDLNYYFQNRGYSFSLSLTPAGGKRVTANLDYSRGDLTSDIIYIIPQLLTADTSFYREDSHFGGLNLDLRVIGRVRLNLGYGVLSSNGSRSTNYHQPRAGIVIPITKRVSWTSEWRYYDYSEKAYSFEDFRNHLITAGLQFSY